LGVPGALGGVHSVAIAVVAGPVHAQRFPQRAQFRGGTVQGFHQISRFAALSPHQIACSRTGLTTPAVVEHRQGATVQRQRLLGR
jgi:hypothetical protein